MDSSPHITKIASPPEKLNTAARTAEEEGSPYKVRVITKSPDHSCSMSDIPQDLAGQVKKLEAHYFEFGGKPKVFIDTRSDWIARSTLKVLQRFTRAYGRILSLSVLLKSVCRSM